MTHYFWYARTPMGGWSANVSDEPPAAKRSDGTRVMISPVYPFEPDEMPGGISLSALTARFPPPQDGNESAPTDPGGPDTGPTSDSAQIEELPQVAVAEIRGGIAPRGIIVRPGKEPGTWDLTLHALTVDVFDNLPPIDAGETFPDWIARVLPPGVELAIEANIQMGFVVDAALPN